MTASTRALVSGRTLLLPFSTRETVWCETPAARATSCMPGSRSGVFAATLVAFRCGSETLDRIVPSPLAGALTCIFRHRRAPDAQPALSIVTDTTATVDIGSRTGAPTTANRRQRADVLLPNPV